jgi:hypothetical protein
MATSSERQNVCKQHEIVRASLFCAIVLALLIVPKGASAQNGVAVVGNTSTSTPYACSTAGVQSAISDAISLTTTVTQHVVDASNCTTMTITSEIDVGTGTTAMAGRIKLILPANGTWTANMTDGTSYALKWGDGAMIYGGTGSGEGQPFSIVAGSSSNLGAVCGTDPSSGQYYHVEGFSCSAASGAKVQSAVLHINASYDESYVGHVSAANWGATSSSSSRVVWIHAACCSATYEDINAEGGNSAGVTPCVFGDFNGAIHISKMSCVHPGSGQNALQIYQSGSSVDNGVGSSYKDIYVEEGTSSDTTTPYVQVTHLSGTFVAADLLDGLRAGVDVTGSTRCMVKIGTGSRINIANLSLGDVSTCAINDQVNSVTLSGAANSVIASYDMTPRYNLALGALTVSTLPSASTANAGTMFRVSDSTTISTEGQTCSGGGSTTALAFSNGSVWKCF